MALVRHRFVFQISTVARASQAAVKGPTVHFLREHVRRLFANLPRAAAGEEEPIHQVRVASRRLRVALPVAACKPAGRRVRRALKRMRVLTRLAGEGRDLDVCAGIFAEEALRASLPESLERTLRKQLGTARARAHRELAKSLAGFHAAKLHANLAAILARGGVETDEARISLAILARRTARGALAELHKLGKRFDPPALHAVRRRIRRLRYYAELDHELFGGRAANVKQLKELQEVLGQLHDSIVLADWMAPAAAKWRTRGNAAQSAAARAFMARLHNRAKILHRAFLTSQPATRLRTILARTSVLLSMANQYGDSKANS